MNDNPLLRSVREVCRFLDEEAIEYMLVGGMAVSIWAEPRATFDIDFLVSIGLGDFDNLKHRLTESGRFVFVHGKPMIFGKVSLLRATLKSNTNVSVDFMFVDDLFKSEALKRKEALQLTDFPIKISAPEDLIILKLLSGRQQDRLDATKILEMQKDNLDMAYLKTWLEKLGLKFKKEREDRGSL
ncbi:MAG: nucleotidyl transferase AbiEii/AbiGii toxin family protein [Nitrospirota bacterium]